uniref:Solute carrier family 15 member 2 n=1 Tax=Amphilophus citrinellus TaxID=61819 RepID=A0A3Q0R2B0_AMPCI
LSQRFQLSFSTKIFGTNYPVSICFIVVNEFCERFSYYGMKALLTLYFLNYLKWDKDLSTAIYHAFSSLCYFTPILGAFIADSWLGKFKTIIYLSIVYVIGHVVKSVGAIPTVGSTDLALSMSGLILIALGTGGIKPCVAAFGGDQFDEEHTTERQKFFSIFYMSINAGSLLSTVITPILRGEYSYLTLYLSCTVVFIAGSGMYKRTPPQGNILWEVCSCIVFAIKNRWNRSKNDPSRKHWLDWAEEKYSGSRWTLQATRMNMAFVRVCLREVMMLNALLILIFVPIFDLIIYPLVTLCGIKITPLRKMATGMVFAALAFGAATLVEVNVVVRMSSSHGSYGLFDVNVVYKKLNINPLFSLSVSLHQDPPQYEILPLSNGQLKFQITFNGSTFQCSEDAQQHKAYSVIVYPDTDAISCKLVSVPTNCYHLSIFSISAYTLLIKRCRFLPLTVLPLDRYTDVICASESGNSSKLNLGLLDFGASYTVILTEESGKIATHKIVDVKANNVHIAYQIPQYVLITAGEVMFSITGLEFSYSQAPANMKSVLQAGWLLTVAFGNVIVLIVAEGAGLEQWIEFLLFASLLLGVFIIFSIMAHFYTYVDPEEVEKIYLENSVREEDDSDLKKKNNEMELKKTGKSTRM